MVLNFRAVGTLCVFSYFWLSDHLLGKWLPILLTVCFLNYKYLIVNLVFSHLGFWNGNFFLIAPFPDRCLLILFLQYGSNYRIDYYFAMFIIIIIMYSVSY